MEKLVAKLKVKLREHAKGIAGYQFLAGCKLFRNEVAPGQRKGGRISAEDFRRVVEYKFGMKLDPDEVLALFHLLVPGTGDSIEIGAMVSSEFLGCRAMVSSETCLLVVEGLPKACAPIPRVAYAGPDEKSTTGHLLLSRRKPVESYSPPLSLRQC